MTSWSIYHRISKHTRVMSNPMQQSMLFFGYLRGPKMHLWIKKISAQLDCHMRMGGREIDEWIWDTMLNNFIQNFQDIMSKERAEKKLFKLRMERGELDEYTSQFQQLSELAGYYEQTGMICNHYFQGLPKGLQEAMIAFKPIKHYQRLDNWIKGAICQHSKYLTFQAYFCYIWTSLYFADTLDCLVSFFLLSSSKPMYDTIWHCLLVQYDLLSDSCTISISEPLILRYLVLGELRSLST